jgi:hypothetical protein
MIPNIFIKPSQAINIFIFKGLLATFCIILSVFYLNYDLVYEIIEAPKRNALLIFYADTFNEINTFLFGQGFNSISWDYDLIAWTEGASKLELTYFEYIRVFGIISFIIFVMIYFYIFISLSKAQNYTELHFLLLSMVNAFVNPYLFSINGIVPLILALGRLNQNAKRQ